MDDKLESGAKYWKIGTYPGRPAKYDAEGLWAKFVEYMDHNANMKWSKEDFIKSGPGAGKKVYVNTQNPPSLNGFMIFAGCSLQWFNDFQSRNEENTAVALHVREIIYTLQLEGAMTNVFNPNIVARKIGLVDKQEIDLKTELTDDERANEIKKLLDKVKKT